MNRRPTNVAWTAKTALFTVFALALLAGCGTTIPPVDELEHFRSKTQTLVLENRGNETLLIVSQSGNRDPLRVPAGGAVRITFVVLTVAELVLREGQTRYQVVGGSARNLIEDSTPSGYLAQPALDATLRVGVLGTGAPPDERRYALNDCRNGDWSAGPAPAKEHSIDIANPPLPGIPGRICP